MKVLEGTNPRSGIGIDWVVKDVPAGSTGAGVSPGSNATDFDGIAGSYLTLGDYAGTYTVEAACGECDSGSPQTFTATAKCPDVPRYYQTDYPDEPYDGICKDYENLTPSGKPGIKECISSNDVPWTIAQKGCALASASMVLKRYNHMNPPDGLNYFLSDNYISGLGSIGYTINGAVKWDAVNYISQQQVKYRGDLSSYGNLRKGIIIDKSSMDEYLKRCIPVIVQVFNPDTKSGHWVVVTGKDGDDYLINDPAYPERTKLSSYGDIYATRVYESGEGGCR